MLIVPEDKNTNRTVPAQPPSTPLSDQKSRAVLSSNTRIMIGGQCSADIAFLDVRASWSIQGLNP